MKTYLIDQTELCTAGIRILTGAREFIAYLQEKGFPYIFLTNNATRTKTQAKEHMLNLGFKNIKKMISLHQQQLLLNILLKIIQKENAS